MDSGFCSTLFVCDSPVLLLCVCVCVELASHTSLLLQQWLKFFSLFQGKGSLDRGVRYLSCSHSTSTQPLYQRCLTSSIRLSPDQRCVAQQRFRPRRFCHNLTTISQHYYDDVDDYWKRPQSEQRAKNGRNYLLCWFSPARVKYIQSHSHSTTEAIRSARCAVQYQSVPTDVIGGIGTTYVPLPPLHVQTFTPHHTHIQHPNPLSHPAFEPFFFFAPSFPTPSNVFSLAHFSSPFHRLPPPR